MEPAKTACIAACIAVTAVAAALIVALGLIIFAENHAPFGAVTAFVAGLGIAVSLCIFAISRSRRRTGARKRQAPRSPWIGS